MICEQVVIQFNMTLLIKLVSSSDDWHQIKEILPVINKTLAAATASIPSGEINAPTFAVQQQIRHEIAFVSQRQLLRESSVQNC